MINNICSVEDRVTEDLENIKKWREVGVDIQMDGRHWFGEMCKKYRCASEVRSFRDAGSLWERFRAREGKYQVGGKEEMVFVLDRRPCGGGCGGERVTFSQTKYVHIMTPTDDDDM